MGTAVSGRFPPPWSSKLPAGAAPALAPLVPLVAAGAEAAADAAAARALSTGFCKCSQ